ncbi:MAG: ABC transporter ATP-binding protein [Planctomycetes bacterium]|nr:ABC transporter ATP-binding protein [Planctomycetota bacterium]
MPETDAPSALIAARDLLLRYPAPGIRGWFGRKGRGVGPLELSVRPGECLALVGPNGSGKSTAIRLLAGLHGPTRGHASIAGFDPRAREGRERLGYVPELSPCPGHLTPVTFLDHLARLSNLDRATRRTRTQALLERFGLTQVAHVPTRTFSRGMRRRLVIAQAFLHEPIALLLDEPTAGLDPPGSLVFEALIREHLAGGGAVVIASHLSREVLELATHLVVLADGATHLQGDATRVLEDPATYELLARDLPAEARESIVREAAQRGATILRSGNARRPLDELFRGLLGEDPGRSR